MKEYFFLLIIIVAGCNNSPKQSGVSASQEKDSVAVRKDTLHKIKVDYTGTPAIIYKTTKDYSDKVPVTLSDDKTKITSYPAPQDIYYNGQLALPTHLSNGYLLDNRGINKNVAFLSITYTNYSKLSSTPPMDSLMGMIIDKSPLLEMYNCGNRSQYKDVVNDLNKIIEGRQLNSYKRLY